MKFILNLFIFLYSLSIISQSLENRVLVIRNTNSIVSMAVADDYMLRRNVTNFLNVSCNDNATNSNFNYLSFQEYNIQIENPIKNYLSTHPEIDFIVLTKGIPLLLYNTPNKPYGGDCSIDSRLAALDYENNTNSSIVNISDLDYGNTFVGQAYANKFWNSTFRFNHSTFGGYLVTRLDGYTQSDAIALTTRSLQAESDLANGFNISGNILLDACANFGFPVGEQPYSIYPNNYVAGQQINITTEGPFGFYNVDMQEAANDLSSNSIPVLFDNTNSFLGNINNLKGYISWGSNDSNYIANNYNSLGFIPGALAETAVSTGARTFLPTTGGQSLIADLVAQGVTGVKGYATEPLLVAVASPKILFNRYTNGWTLAESFYCASRLINWMDIVIGDPICRAYDSNLNVSNFDISKKIKVFPNPSSDVIYIDNLEKNHINIVDVIGKTVLEITNYQKNDKIDVSKFENGIYFIKINSSKSNNLKFIKK